MATLKSFFSSPALLKSVLIVLSSGLLCSCVSVATGVEAKEDYSLLEQDTLVIARGDTVRVELSRGLKKLQKLKVQSDPRVKILKRPTPSSPTLELLAKNEGKGSIALTLSGRTDSLFLYVGKENLIKVAAVGNSFSEDALENPFLWRLFKESGRDIYIVNGYIPGASLERHIKEIQSGAPAYNVRTILPDGSRSRKQAPLKQMLQGEQWDFISLQQVSQDSGKKESFTTELPTLHRMVDSLKGSSPAKYLLHQTWAYGPQSTHGGFLYYGKDQEAMFQAIESAYRYAAELIPTHRIIPSGKAVQNLRETGLFGRDLTRDGYHLKERTGMLVAACTWYMALSGEDVRKNPFTPEGYTSVELQAIKEAAYRAVTEK